jgi:hypothetical protein
MNDGSVLVLFLLVPGALPWFFVCGHQAKEAREERERRAAEVRAERERRDAEDRARREAERSRLKVERQALSKSIRSGAPDFILKARLEFEREYRAKGGEVMFGQEMSPLVCFGHRVSKTAGRTLSERRTILAYAVAADYDATLPFLPALYRNDWGSPLSVTPDQMADLGLLPYLPFIRKSMPTRSNGRWQSRQVIQRHARVPVQRHRRAAL